MKISRRSFLKVLSSAAAAVTAGASGIANAFEGMGFEYLSNKEPEPEASPLMYVGRPSQAVIGDVYFDTHTPAYFMYDGTNWVTLKEVPCPVQCTFL